MLNRGQGYRTALATATRGNGGQNEIGPEMFEALGVLRTEELAALHRFDGAEQYFTRAVDFGFSFSIEETFEKWGREEIIGDFVRLIRMIRPDVITGMTPDRRPAAVSTIRRRRCSRAKRSSSPAIRRSTPNRSKTGCGRGSRRSSTSPGRSGRRRPGAGRRRILPVEPRHYDPLLGKTYAEIGTEARSMHKCQGHGAAAGAARPVGGDLSARRVDVAGQLQRDETALFDGIDTTIAGLAQFAGRAPAGELIDGWPPSRRRCRTRRKRFDSEATRRRCSRCCRPARGARRCAASSGP